MKQDEFHRLLDFIRDSLIKGSSHEAIYQQIKLDKAAILPNLSRDQYNGWVKKLYKRTRKRLDHEIADSIPLEFQLFKDRLQKSCRRLNELAQDKKIETHVRLQAIKLLAELSEKLMLAHLDTAYVLKKANEMLDRDIILAEKIQFLYYKKICIIVGAMVALVVQLLFCCCVVWCYFWCFLYFGYNYRFYFRQAQQVVRILLPVPVRIN